VIGFNDFFMKTAGGDRMPDVLLQLFLSFIWCAHMSLQIIIYLILALALPPMLEFPFILRILR
jgi:hypothetical protein